MPLITNGDVTADGCRMMSMWLDAVEEMGKTKASIPLAQSIASGIDGVSTRRI